MTNEFENLNEKTTSDNTNSTVDNTTENTADVTPIENENNQETELFENTKRINWSRYIPYGAQFPVSKASSIQ